MASPWDDQRAIRDGGDAPVASGVEEWGHQLREDRLGLGFLGLGVWGLRV